MKRLLTNLDLVKIKKLKYLVFIAFVGIAATALYQKPEVKIQQAHSIKKTLKPLQISIAPRPKPTPPKPAPTAAPKPAPVVAPAPVASPKPVPTIAPAAPAPAPITPTPSSSVPTLKPAPTTTTSSSTTSSSSGTSTSGSSSTSSSSPSSSGSTTSTPATTQYQSTNWSGYFSATTNTQYTSVAGSWTAVSPTNSTGTTAYDANWIGIGGITSNDLIQVGINNEVSSTGQLTVQAFYETLPSPATTISSLSVSPGDSIKASITEVAPNSWIITITDETQNKTYTKTVSYTSSLSSAEWIEEDPSDTSGALLPLDNFGTVNFTQALTTANSTSSNLTQLNANSITMVNSSGGAEATPSAIGTDGASFSVNRN